MTHTHDPYHMTQESIAEHQHVEAIYSEQEQLGRLSLEISVALIEGRTLRTMLTLCTEALVRYMDAAFARIWTLNEEESILELQASSGLYTHLDGKHARVPVGAFKIGLIAAERKPHLTNKVIGDPRVSDQEWAQREGMVAFAGYPLLVGERLTGVMAIFARHPVNAATLQAMATIANSIALGVERLQMLEERERLLIREQAARKAAEIAQQRLELAQRVGRVGTFEWEIRDNHILWTPELEALYGLPAGGFEGKYENWVQRVHPADLKYVEESLHGAVAGGPPYNVEFRVVWPDGTVRWVLAKGEVSNYDEEDQPLQMIGINIDITERKEAEEQKALMFQRLQDLNANLEAIVDERTEVLRQLNKELERSNQELQDFAYVASHDLQEPLRKIQAFGNLLEEEYKEKLGDGKAYLDRMRNAAGRMRVLIDDLLTFSRVTTKAQPFSSVDLNAVMDQVIDDLGPLMQATQGTIEVGELPTIEADAQQMYHMLQNLIGNALKFHKTDVPPVVKVMADVRPNPQATQIPADEECLLSIKDNGIGFNEKYLDRIFTVFQRLHGRGDYEGTGIGLAVVRKIVERHGGTITAESAVGEGATFLITLPMRHH